MSKKRNEKAKPKNVVTVRLDQGELDGMLADMDSMPVRPSRGAYVKQAIAMYPRLRKLHGIVKAGDGDDVRSMLDEAGL